MDDMSETPQSEPETGPIDPVAPHAAPVATAPVPTVVERRHGRLNQVAAWIGVVAGSVFIVAAIFFSGFFMGLVAGQRWPSRPSRRRRDQSEWHHHHGGASTDSRVGPGPGSARWTRWIRPRWIRTRWTRWIRTGGFGGPGGPGGLARRTRRPRSRAQQCSDTPRALTFT